jgi:hypothetical protein
MITQKNRLSIILSAIFLLLLIPLVAMQFTNQVDWSTSDFLIMGILLLGTGLIIEGVFRLVKKLEYRLVLCGAVLLVFFLIWAELAVGVFGTPFAGS